MIKCNLIKNKNTNLKNNLHQEMHFYMPARNNIPTISGPRKGLEMDFPSTWFLVNFSLPQFWFPAFGVWIIDSGNELRSSIRSFWLSWWAGLGYHIHCNFYFFKESLYIERRKKCNFVFLLVLVLVPPLTSVFEIRPCQFSFCSVTSLPG